VQNLPLDESQFDESFLILYAGVDRAEAQRLFDLAEKKSRLFCSVDDPQRCNTIFPAIARSGSVQVAVSTAGLSPTLARRIKDEIQTRILADDIGDFAAFLGRARSAFQAGLPNMQERRKFWDYVIDSDVRQILHSQGEVAAMKRLEEMFEEAIRASPEP